jgi:hypothetical protein
MQTHWEIAWTTLRPLSEQEVESSVEALARLGCSLTNFVVEAIDNRYVSVRHRTIEECVLEFGFAEDAPCGGRQFGRGLVEDGGHIRWNWCCTERKQPETGLILRKLSQIQAITGDKLLVWDDDGRAHWSWGACPLEQVGIDPMAVVDGRLHEPAAGRLAS